MEQLKKPARRRGLDRNGLRFWGLLFLALGAAGRGIIQNRMLGVGERTIEQLLQVMEASDDAMIYATTALLLQAVETCAVPIFCFLLVDGFQRTADRTRYLARVAGVALLSEVPYDLAMGGGLLDFGRQNPVWALALAFVVLLFYSRYAEKGVQNTLIKLAVTAAAMVWGGMLRIENGASVVLVVAVLWLFRANSIHQNLMGSVAALACSIGSPLMMATPMGFLVVHGYNGQKGKGSRVFNCLAYPVMLLIIALTSLYAV